MHIDITRRQRFFIFTAALSVLVYFYLKQLPQINIPLIAIIGLLIPVGSFWAHSPNSRILNIIVTSITPMALAGGYMLSMAFFPNFSNIFKIASIVVFANIFYILLLVNNVFLVVESRKEPIPLFRVAITWSKILIAAVAIPLLAGVFKISVNSFFEAGITTGLSLLFFIYLTWALRHDTDVKTYKIGEIAAIVAFGSFMVTVASISVSFIPTETFLRAMYVASILIFGISYFEAHLKNSITKKLINEHIAISLLFLILLFVFKP